MTRAILFAAAGPAALVAGCGDDEPTLSAAEFREQAHEICATGGAEVLEAFFGVSGDDEPTPEEMEAALAGLMSVSRRQLDDIEVLAERSDLSDDVDTFIARTTPVTSY